ncbi:tetraacyldisaccharide 4'-kinase [Paracidobacterium acidisoli]|uniref:tetraacyldisaccharide 4'-kinase n=1 Tax=Paracidobacterium acidisoli TaxID=2303751 RepID=UPI001314E5BD|nr:tetraacyldisaccharide 4'-kinase [Paracidobacterium acidisoli]MBT9333195.1 tetraacyldisaccharide 4'-kinase [Paracidobacterium acidisoli]
MSRLLYPLVPLYAAAAAAKSAAYDRGWLRAKRLRWPVVSVGNLSVGGSGKTPLVIRLAQLLCHRGVDVDVLSRGYGRSSAAVERVDENGSAERFGDEPLLIARAAHVPVYVAAKRFEAGLLAERGAAEPGLHLLDDGFQHRQLRRDLDIVVLHRSDFAQSLLPAGRLREPLSALQRASVLVLREEDRGLEAELRRRRLTQPVWFMQRRLEAPPVQRAVAFCGIARPEEFFAALRSAGIELCAALSFRDHHRWTRDDITKLIEWQRQHRAKAFVTTEKDGVRLPAALRSRLESAAPLYVAPLTVHLDDEAAAVDLLLRQAVRK